MLNSMGKNNIEIVLPSGRNTQSNPNQRMAVELPSTNRKGSGRARRRRNRRQRRRLETDEANMLEAMVSNKLSLKGENITRSGRMPNPADPRTTSALTQLGSTIGGRMAALKVLHPNGEGDEYVTRFPDGCANTTIVMERRDEFKLEAPATALTGQRNWNCIVIENPFLLATSIALRWDSAQTPSVADLNAAMEEALTYPGRATRQWPAWETVEIDAFDLDISVLGATALTPNYLDTQSGPATDIKSVRRTYMGCTFDLDASDLYNQGRVVAGQWKPDVTLGLANVNDGGTPPVSIGSVNVYLMQTPAATINNIVQSDELVYQAEAKCGLYIPIRPAEMDIPMTACQEYRTMAPRVPSENPVPIFTAGQTISETRDVWLRGWMIGVSYWSDIDYRASLRIKRKEGIEFISAPAGPFAPFADEALPADIRAQQMIQEFSRREPHAYPADFNELGKLLQNIVGGIADAVSSLGIPVLSDIGTTVGGLARGKVGSGLAGMLDKLF